MLNYLFITCQPGLAPKAIQKNFGEWLINRFYIRQMCAIDSLDESGEMKYLSWTMKSPFLQQMYIRGLLCTKCYISRKELFSRLRYFMYWTIWVDYHKSHLDDLDSRQYWNSKNEKSQHPRVIKECWPKMK